MGEFIKRLEQYPADMPIGLCVGIGGELEILSVYSTDPGTPGARIDGKETLWIDLGDQE